MKLLKVSAHVRYWEDCRFNGTELLKDEDIFKDGKCIIPCAELVDDEWRWNLDIDAETGKVLNWVKGNEIATNFKVCDECRFEYFENDEKILTYDDYVPDFLSLEGSGFGDYIFLFIDTEGNIRKWNYDNFIEEIEKIKNWLKNKQ